MTSGPDCEEVSPWRWFIEMHGDDQCRSAGCSYLKLVTVSQRKAEAWLLQELSALQYKDRKKRLPKTNVRLQFLHKLTLSLCETTRVSSPVANNSKKHSGGSSSNHRVFLLFSVSLYTSERDHSELCVFRAALPPLSLSPVPPYLSAMLMSM